MDPTNAVKEDGIAITIHSPPSDLDGVDPNQEELPSLRNLPKKRIPNLFKMAKGYVRYKQGSTADERRLYWERVKFNPKLKDDPDKRPISDCWLFHNRQYAGKGMPLYAGQIMALVELLPSAFKAALDQDTSYFEVVAEGKTNRLTLEVFYNKEDLTLALKQYYIPKDRVDDDTQEWIPVSNFFPFDPEKDEPLDLLEYVLITSEN